MYIDTTEVVDGKAPKASLNYLLKKYGLKLPIGSAIGSGVLAYMNAVITQPSSGDIPTGYALWDGLIATDEYRPFTEEEELENIKTAVQLMLDQEAQSMGYESVATCVTYADEPAVSKFKLEGEYMRARRSTVWATCYTILSDYQLGNIPKPSKQDVLDAMPAFVAPV